MKWITHIVSTFCLIVVLAKYISITYLGFTIALTMAIFPDWFESVCGFKHRSKYIHNIIIPAATSFLIIHPTLSGFGIGYGHHLLIDATTRYGVYFGNKRIKGILNTYNLAHNALIIFVHVLLVFLTVF